MTREEQKVDCKGSFPAAPPGVEEVVPVPAVITAALGCSRPQYQMVSAGSHQIETSLYQYSSADLRASRQSLVEDGRRSRGPLQRSLARKSTRQSGRSRSREKLGGPSYRGERRPEQGDRGSSGYRSRGSRDGDSLPDSDNWATSTGRTYC